MNKLQTFEQFLTTQTVHVPITALVINLFIGALLSFILSRIYVKYGNSLSNRKMFAKNFMMLTLTTLLIITIVKSSLALSLGLVGALSIVRFRSAIKEPEELSYLFLNIAIGLGLGADQRLVTIVAFVVIMAIITLKSYRTAKEYNQNLHLVVSSYNPQKTSLDQIVKVLQETCLAVDLKRYEETKEILEASFLVELKDMEGLSQSKDKLQALSDNIKITFLDNKGLI